MALSSSEVDLIHELNRLHAARRSVDERHLRYYLLRQRIEQLGMAVPPSMRQFLVVANWARVVVRTIASRQKVRSLILPGEETADPILRAIWDGNNLDSHAQMYRKDKLIYGRAFMSVGANEGNPGLPIVRVESPREVEAIVDTRTEAMTSAARFYGKGRRARSAPLVTLYQPGVTVHAARDSGGRWQEVERDEFDGDIPLIMGLNNRLSGSFEGESELTDIIMFIDATARSLTNLQFAQEAHGVPSIGATGVASGDFIDPVTKDPVPQFEAYFDAIKILTNKDAKWTQFMAADLKNFDTAVNIYGKQAAVSYGFPASKFGITSTNPASEGSIRADENDLVNYAEEKNASEAAELGWVGALAYEYATGDPVEGNRVRTDHFDPGTPTFSQRADALTKMRAVGGISREGMWDELGWSEARKAKERAYFAAEAAEAAADPYLASLMVGANDRPAG